jgi:nucleoside-diphosphate-sugar epimerase
MNLDLTQFSGRRVLITGAGGFLGSHLCRRLRGCGAELHAVSRQSRAADEPGLRWWRGDLVDAAFVQEVVASVRPDVVFHLASHVAGARDLGLVPLTVQGNLLSAVNLMTAAAAVGCQRLVLAGSYEEPEEGNAVPCSPYAAAKWAASAYARMFHALYGLPVVILRICMAYGPGQMDTRKFIPHVILSLLRGERPGLSSGCRPVDWVFIEDVIDGLVTAAAAEHAGGATLDIGSGALVTVREVAERLVRLVDPDIAPHFGAVGDRPLETVRSADTARTEQLIGWRPRTPLEEGLRKTVEWYRRRFARASASGMKLT